MWTSCVLMRKTPGGHMLSPDRVARRAAEPSFGGEPPGAIMETKEYRMGLEDIVAKAKDALGGGKADDAIDQAAEFIKDKTPDNIDGHVDTVADKAKEFLGEK